MRSLIFIFVTVAVLGASSFVSTAPFARAADAAPTLIPTSGTKVPGVSAQSYIALDAATGSVLYSYNADNLWRPASLTKLLAALVVLDEKVKMTSLVSMKTADEVGGSRLATKVGAQYTRTELLHASLMGSANNATNALARSTGLTKKQFVARMNAKAKALGASFVDFVEPTGISEDNRTTAQDYIKVARAAFANPVIADILTKTKYTFSAKNNKKIKHTLGNTNKLLGDADIAMLGGKTGYIEESGYSFTARVKDKLGNDIIVLVFGSSSRPRQFTDTKLLAQHVFKNMPEKNKPVAVK